MKDKFIASTITSLIYLYAIDTMAGERIYTDDILDFPKQFLSDEEIDKTVEAVQGFIAELSKAEIAFLVLTVMKPIMPALTYIPPKDFSILVMSASSFSGILQKLNEHESTK